MEVGGRMRRSGPSAQRSNCAMGDSSRPISRTEPEGRDVLDLIMMSAESSMAQTRRWSVTGAPNRTTEMPDRDERARQPKSPVIGPVSGSDSSGPNRQNPAESRDSLGPDPDVRESLCLRRLNGGGRSRGATGLWGWTESRTNSSLRTDPCSAGKIQGSPPISDSPKRIRPEIPKCFRTNSVEFPVIRNREFFSMSREIPGNENLDSADAIADAPP
jgi:hypothetical protein